MEYFYLVHSNLILKKEKKLYYKGIHYEKNLFLILKFAWVLHFCGKKFNMKINLVYFAYLTSKAKKIKIKNLR